jgi:hypothetical protein
MRRRRRLIGWGVVVGLTMLELLAALLARPSVLQGYPFAAAFIDAVGDWIPVVESFSRCAATRDATSGLVLVLNFVFLPVKLAALCYAHPFFPRPTPYRGWRRAWAVTSAILVGALALVPLYLWSTLEPTVYGLRSLDRKIDALCSGGIDSFLAATLQGGFALLGAYAAVLVIAAMLRGLFFETAETFHTENN